MSITPSNLVDSFVPKLLDFQRVRLEGVAIAIFWHLTNYSATIAKLAHLSTAPRVETAFLVGVPAVVLHEELEIDLVGTPTIAPVVSLHVHLTCE